MTNSDRAINNSRHKGGGDFSTPIHLTRQTKPSVPECSCDPTRRQSSSKNTSVYGPISGHRIPSLNSRDATNNTQQHFSLACKRLSNLMMCVSLYIVLFSSSGIGVYSLGDVEQLNKHESQPGIHNNNLRKKRPSTHLTTSPKQIPVPDFEFESSSTDDSGDDSGDDAPDKGDGAESPIIAGHHGGETFQNPILEHGGGAKKRRRPTMTHAKSVFSSQMQGAPKPKHNQDTEMYNYRDIMNDANNSRIQKSNLYEDINMQMKKRSTLTQHKSLLNTLLVSDQNNSPLSYNGHISENYDSYKNEMILYGHTTNQVILCLAWFFSCSIYNGCGSP